MTDTRDKEGGYKKEHWGRGSTLVRWTLAEPGWLGTASGVRAASMAGLNSEKGRDFMNMHVLPSHGGGNKNATWTGAGDKCVGGWY